MSRSTCAAHECNGAISISSSPGTIDLSVRAGRKGRRTRTQVGVDLILQCSGRTLGARPLRRGTRQIIRFSVWSAAQRSPWPRQIGLAGSGGPIRRHVVALDGFQISPLVHTLWAVRAAPKRLASSLRRPRSVVLRVGQQDAHMLPRSPLLKTCPERCKWRVGKACRPGNIACALPVDAIGSQVY